MSLNVDIRHQLGDLDLQVRFRASAGITALFGHSGSGKTTVVNAVAGLLSPDKGQITLDGTPLFDTSAGINLKPHQRRLGYVFQDARLFPHLSVRGNLIYGQRFAPRGSSGPSLEQISELLGISQLLARRPLDLSGGEKQRVAIGRALLARPRMLLMDEPLAALDETRKGDILPYLEQLRDIAGLPILYVSHSLTEVARLASTLVVLDRGKAVRAGATDDLMADPALARQLGLRDAGALLTAQISQHHADGLSELQVSAGRLFLPRLHLPEGSSIRVRILAKDVILSRAAPTGLSALNILPGTVTELHAGDGPGVLVQVRCGQDRILARITRRSAAALDLAPGVPCHVIVKSVSVARHDIARG